MKIMCTWQRTNGFTYINKQFEISNKMDELSDSTTRYTFFIHVHKKKLPKMLMAAMASIAKKKKKKAKDF